MKRPASLGQHCRTGKSQQREIVALDDFLAGAGGDSLGKELAHLRQHGEHLYFVEKALRRLYVHEGADAVGDFVEGINLQRQIHAAGGAELVDQDLRAGMAFDVLEQEGGAACARRLPGWPARHGRDARPHMAFCLRGR